MKTLALVAIGVGVLGVAALAFQPRDMQDHAKKETAAGKMKVGNQPGDIGKSSEIDKTAASRGHELATFAAGCFWGVEERFRQIPGVVASAVGYMNGHTTNPTYRDVCSHGTGHAEAVLLEFDPKVVKYEELLDVFWKNHDPTTKDRQGPDVGDQYRSAVFYRSEDQRKAAERLKGKLNREKFDGRVVTEIAAASTFWMAEDYHQQYCAKNGIDACPIR